MLALIGVMAAALLGLGRIKGIDRPAIAGVLPNVKGFTVLLDIGANTDCKPHNLLQFGIMGYLYAKNILGVEEPRVGLLSNGEEKTKYSIGQPIEPQKLGLKIEGLPNERLSPRQAIGLLIEWKKETPHAAEEIVSPQNS